MKITKPEIIKAEKKLLLRERRILGFGSEHHSDSSRLWGSASASTAQPGGGHPDVANHSKCEI